MGLKCGIVGLPNVGKSTLFNALTSARAEASNYPFCTIEPNMGIVKVPDPRLNQLEAIANPEKLIPAVVEFVDIAGLVKGASKGEGLGNKFLGHIKEVDAIVHVIRCFEDADVTHVSGKTDPCEDAEVIETELMLKDLETVEKAQLKARKSAASKEETQILQKAQDLLERGQWLSALEFSDPELEVLRPLFLISMKPVLYVANLSEEDLAVPVSEKVPDLLERAKNQGQKLIGLCSKIEAEIAELDLQEEREEFLEGLGLSESGLDVFIRTAYDLLGLETFFTAGPKEVRAWTVLQGTLAPAAAGVIHTDFQKGFIRAEVIGFEDYLRCKGEQRAKEEGVLRVEGKDYAVKDGDVVHFRFNV